MALFNAEQYVKVIADWVYPSIQGVLVRWHPERPETGNGFGTVLVPEQSPSAKPFLVKRFAQDEKSEGAVFAYFERRHSSSPPVSVHEVQSLMRDGRLLRSAIDLRESVEGLRPAAAVPISSGRTRQVLEATMTARAGALVDAAGLAAEPCYVLAALPMPPLDASPMFESSRSPIVDLLWHPPAVRRMGFDLGTTSYPDIHEGESRRSVLPAYKALEFFRDGTLLFVGRADEDFLSWGERNAADPLTMSPVALIESVLTFFNLVTALYGVLAKTPEETFACLYLRRMCVNGQRPRLRAGPSTAHVPPWHIKAAPDCEATLGATFPGNFEPNYAAYVMVSRVYEWFGLDHESIPYIDRTGGRPRVSPQQIGAI